MDWMDENLPDDFAIAVVNETGSRTTANVGCRTDGDVLFVDRVVLDPGERREWNESVVGAVEIGVQVRGGSEATERFDPGDGSGRVSATIAAGSISFSTAGRRDGTGGADGGASGGSFAAAETNDAGDDGWGFDGNSAASGDAWGFEDGATGTGADGPVDAVSGDSSESASTAGASADSGWGFGGDDADGSDGSDGNGGSGGHRSSDRSGGETTSRTGSADSTGRPSASTGADRSSSRRRGGSGDDRDSGDDRGAGADASGTDSTGPDERDGDAGVSDDRAGSATERDDGPTAGGADADRPGSDTDDIDEPEDEASAEEEKRQAGAGEKYCRSCGAVIKQAAEICPECGVSNEGSVSGGGGAGSAGPASEPSDWSTGVLVGGGLWGINLVILLVLVVTFRTSMAGGVDAGGLLQSLGLAAVLPVTQFLAWVVFAIAIYYDMKYVRYHVADWPLSGTLYIAAAIVLPIFTQVFGAAALFVGGSVGLAVAGLVPAILLGLAVRHTRTRSRLLSSA